MGGIGESSPVLRRPLGRPIRLLLRDVPEVDEGNLDVGANRPFMPFGDAARLFDTTCNALNPSDGLAEYENGLSLRTCGSNVGGVGIPWFIPSDARFCGGPVGLLTLNKPAVGSGKNVGEAGRDAADGMELVELAVETRDCGRRTTLLGATV